MPYEKGRLPISKYKTFSSSDKQRVNEEIRVRQVRLIDGQGEQLGVMTTREALQIARERELDLVEVAPDASPPVCRLMDFGKFMYTKSKRERQARKNQVKTEVKEIQLRPKTGEHDIQFKLRDAQKWLERGSKVKVRIRFRGREVTHPEVAYDLMKRIANDLKSFGTIEQKPAFEGRSMLMILAPVKTK